MAGDNHPQAYAIGRYDALKGRQPDLRTDWLILFCEEHGLHLREAEEVLGDYHAGYEAGEDARNDVFAYVLDEWNHLTSEAA